MVRKQKTKNKKTRKKKNREYIQIVLRITSLYMLWALCALGPRFCRRKTFLAVWRRADVPGLKQLERTFNHAKQPRGTFGLGGTAS
jgi:hypothetical protein